MIMIWNRKEVFMGYSLKKFNEVREILAANKIKYNCKVVNNNRGTKGSIRSIIGNFGENMDYAYTYYIYVHKEDYDNACVVLQNN
ncbi:hypothetical protein SH2C18_35260 [Clostridium sediminicola]|uniref:hypothetical protein n=1 Tax=Clostridium sediminicola TaxID=3114879 RepID=UPI0031F273E8